MAHRQRPDGPFRRRPRARRRRPHGQQRPQGYTAPGFRPLWDLMLPETQGRERRALFNGMALWVAASVGAVGAVAGATILGPLGLLVGLAGGLWLGGLTVEHQRFYRP